MAISILSGTSEEVVEETRMELLGFPDIDGDIDLHYAVWRVKILLTGQGCGISDEDARRVAVAKTNPQLFKKTIEQFAVWM